MATLADPRTDSLFWPANSPWAFWRLLLDTASTEDWVRASVQALYCLDRLPAALSTDNPLTAIVDVLSESQFGPSHWRLSRTKSLYYQVVRPVLPVRLRPVLRSLFKRQQRNDFPLGWPVEDRLVRFQFEMLGCLLESKGLASAPYIHFWPAGRRFAFVLTHDVEAERGQRFVRAVAALEERYGFRSSFNFVPEGYPVDRTLLAELQERGFEVGVHGLKHDGRLFSSHATFLTQARRINEYAASWDAVGFRSPLTHRQPEWMQALEVEYDSSFFDTDPFETIPGGTLSIWPFTIGRIVELPYTLAQDHTLMVTLGETTPRLWLEKVDFIASCCGLALLNAHPDYLTDPKHLAIYETFLRQMRERSDYWHSLPREVARWWRKRAEVAMEWDGSRWTSPGAPEATLGEVHVGGGCPQSADPLGSLILVPDPVRA